MMILIGLQYDNDHYDNAHDDYDNDYDEYDHDHDDTDTDASSVLLEMMSRWWPWWWEGDTQDITSWTRMTSMMSSQGWFEEDEKMSK